MRQDGTLWDWKDVPNEDSYFFQISCDVVQASSSDFFLCSNGTLHIRSEEMISLLSIYLISTRTRTDSFWQYTLCTSSCVESS